MKCPTVLVTQPDGTFSSLLREAGFDVLNLELVRTEPVEDLGELNSRLDNGDEFDGIFITSPVAAKILVARVNELSRDLDCKIYVLGERAREVVETAGLNVVYRPSANTASDLVGAFDTEEFAGRKLLFIRGDRSLRTIPELLQSISRVDEVVVYRTIDVWPDDSEVSAVISQLAGGLIHWVCFFSPSGVESFVKRMGEHAMRIPAVATIGETTAQSARGLGLAVDFVSTKSTASDFAATFVEYIKNID